MQLSLVQVRVRRIQIFPLFEDYDRVHIGSVTRSQVEQVMIGVHYMFVWYMYMLVVYTRYCVHTVHTVMY